MLILISAFYISCNRKKDIGATEIQHEKVTSPSQSYLDEFQNTEKIKQLIYKVKEGDTLAYRKLRHIFYYSGHSKEFLYYAMLTAEQDYPLAYFDVYTLLYSLKNPKSKTNKLANYYLFLAYEKHAEHSKTTIEERFGNSFRVPNAEDYWREVTK